MLVQLLAAAALVLFLWSLLRFALGLRAAKIAREEERGAQESAGRRVVAELPLDERVVLVLEDRDGFYWAGREVRKERVRGAWLLLNGVVVATCSRAGGGLPPVLPPTDAEYDGSERWSVTLHTADGVQADMPCGRLREGVSRDAARKVFDAVAAVCATDPPRA